MRISYKWLSEYLPVPVDPDRINRILTSIGLEVESMENYEEIKGGLSGLVIGEVLSTEKHPNADKLTLTKVNIGNNKKKQGVFVCSLLFHNKNPIYKLLQYDELILMLDLFSSPFDTE